MQVNDVLKSWIQLENVSDSAKLDVELLLCFVLSKPRSFLYTWPEKELSGTQWVQFNELLNRRKQGEPIAYLTGSTGFWTLELAVATDTLIPRPETELLVELALAELPTETCRVADLGTGTGAIALALASERPCWHIDAVDRIPQAVNLAEHNRQVLGFNNVTVLQGSWFEPLSKGYQLIVSNPPYIDPLDPHLTQGDVRFEPESALTAGDKGMADIRTIAEQATRYLSSGGWLMFEHGYDQGEASRSVLEKFGYQCISTEQDFGQRDRVTKGRWLETLDAK